MASLDQYDIDQLRNKPYSDTRSLGQMYRHLIDETTFFIDRIEICISTNDHAQEEAFPFAAAMLKNNDFPEEVI